MKITRFKLLRGPFIHRDQACRRELKIMQNDAKMHHRSPRNEHEKNIDSDRAMLKNARRRPTCKIASKRVRFCRYGDRCCFAHAINAKIAQNHWNFTMKSPQKVRNSMPYSCNGQKRTLSIDLRTCIKTRWFLSFPLLLCSRHGIRCKFVQIFRLGFRV